MKIAICFNGQIRDGVDCSKNILEYIGDLKENCDFFVHTWDIDTVSHNIGLPSERQPFTQYPVSQSTIHDFREVYNPKRIVIEEFNNTQIQNIQGGLRFNKQLNKNVVAMFESGYYVNSFKQDYERDNDFKYDYVVRMRPDLIFSSSKSLKDDLSQVDEKTFVYGAHAECYGPSRVEDVLWFATSENMDKIANFYDFYGDSRSCWQIASASYIRNECGLSVNCLNNNDFTVYYNQYKTHFKWNVLEDAMKCVLYFKDLCKKSKRR